MGGVKMGLRSVTADEKGDGINGLALDLERTKKEISQAMLVSCSILCSKVSNLFNLVRQRPGYREVLSLSDPSCPLLQATSVLQ